MKNTKFLMLEEMFEEIFEQMFEQKDYENSNRSQKTFLLSI